jgi:hypothetical protein
MMSEDCHESKVTESVCVEKLYSAKLGEPIIYRTIDKCVEYYIDEFEIGEEPETIEIEVWERVKIRERDIECLSESTAEQVVEWLDEMFSDAREEYDYNFDITDLTKKYIENVCKEYVPYNCERTGEVIIIKTKDYL